MKSINNNAPVKCSKTILINVSPEKVWAVMTDINNWPNWQRDISQAKINGQLIQETDFTWKTGGVKIKSTLHTVKPFSQFGWTGKTFGMFAVHNWTLNEENGQTRVSVDESMEGAFAKLFRNKFNKNLERDMQHWLEALKAESEK